MWKMKINCIYLCVIAEPWVEVANKLESEYGISPKYIIHWGDESSNFEDAFPDSYRYSLEKAWKGLCFPEDLSISPLDEPTLNSISKYELLGIKMMDRLDPTRENFNFAERQEFFRELVMQWLTVIRDSDIKLVISPSIPHRVFDYALYVAAKIESIDFYTFQMVPFGSRTILIDDIDSMGVSSLEETKDKGLRTEIDKKIELVKGDYKDAIPSYMVHQQQENRRNFKKYIVSFLRMAKGVKRFFGNSPNTYWVEKGKSPQNSKYNWLNYYFIKVKQKRHLKRLKNQYESLTEKVAGNERYALVALHYQPEETSCPTGGVFVNQELIVNMLVEVLPSECLIYVKEHKSQFYSSMEGAVGRDVSFYRKLLSISPRVKLISADDNPFHLIDNALCVCTISGTIGWESALRGTPAIHFGRAWYEGMPLTYKVKSLGDLSMALQSIENKNSSSNEVLDSQYNFHYRLATRFIHAKHYKANYKNTDVDFKNSKENLVKSILGKY
tara:strand:+ start:8914 stop:10410 length:1497 start_codon:yes stop_codon:yes gene_type:complete